MWAWAPPWLAVGVGFLVSPASFAGPSTRLDPVGSVPSPAEEMPHVEIPAPASVFPAAVFWVLIFAPLAFFL